MGDKKPLTVILIGVINKNQVLLIQRKNEPYKGYWCMPGGKQELGEEIRQTAKREIMEETGFTLKQDISIKGMYSEILLDKQGKVKDHFIFVVCKAFLNDKVKQKRLGEKCDAACHKWFDFPFSDKDKKQIIPTDLLMLTNFNAEKPEFKEFIQQEIEDGKKVKILNVIEEA